MIALATFALGFIGGIAALLGFMEYGRRHWS